MTSEKHTHNMLVLQQNVKHMQRDMQFQMSQLTMMGQDPMSIMAGLPPGFSPGLPPFPFDQMFMGPIHGGPLMPSMVESPMDLTKQENGMLPNLPKMNANYPADMKNNNNEVSRIFQCSVCNIFSTDSLEALHQHMQQDRQKVMGEQDDSTSVVGGTYMCNLCQYKTNLKANFQLHCKTDKHLQRLQLVNHIREGGPGNKWRLKYMSAGNPVQVRCNACDYHTNSVHKLQLHRTNPQHETNAQLFHHLQLRESCLPADVLRYFVCTLCSYKTRTKVSLIQHIHTMSHMHNEGLRVMQLKEQGKQHEYVIENIFQVKEYTEDDHVKFDDQDGEPKEVSGMHDELTSEEEFHGGKSGNINCPFCNFETNSEMQIQLHIQTQHMGPHAPMLSPSGGASDQMSIPTLRCPLCQEKCHDQPILEKHLSQIHSVSPEGMHHLLSLVFTDESGNSALSRNKPVHLPKSRESTTVLSDKVTCMDAVNSEENDNSQKRPVKSIVSEPAELQAEMLENHALKLAEEASKEGVVLTDNDGEDTYRCQTCTKTFTNIDSLYSHQNELGHLELKQTPRGPGYLCWKKGCNQYFKTADALQNHFREIHAKNPLVPITEHHAYKFKCTQCNLSFKSVEKLQLHSYLHIIRSASVCVVCGNDFHSIASMRKHVESSHVDTMTPNEMELYRSNLASIAPFGLLGLSMMDHKMLSTGQVPPLIPFKSKQNRQPPVSSTKDTNPTSDFGTDSLASSGGSVLNIGIAALPNQEEDCSNKKTGSDGPLEEDDGSQSENEYTNCKDDYYFEDYINSQAVAENSYSDPTRKFKCHRCKVAFTKQNYLSAHNKTLMHRKGDKSSNITDKYMDPNRPYKCEVCRESFTQKSILLVHYNSVSHLHKLKLHQQHHEELKEESMSGVDSSNETDTNEPSTGVNCIEDEHKPFKCNICKIAYSHRSTLDFHLSSVEHLTNVSKTAENRDTTSTRTESALPSTANEDNANKQSENKDNLKRRNYERTTPNAGSPHYSTTDLSSDKGRVETMVKYEDSAATKNHTIMPDKEYVCQNCNAAFTNNELLEKHQKLVCFQQPGSIKGVPRYKQQVQRSLLENIGFECVMQFNEYLQKKCANDNANASNTNVRGTNDNQKIKIEKMDDDQAFLPEINKCRCKTCDKEFSSVWVLKAHQEEVHRQLLPIEYIEEFSKKFKQDYDKKQKLIHSVQQTENLNSGSESLRGTEVSPLAESPSLAQHMFDENLMNLPHFANELAMAQAMQMMQMPMLMNGLLPLPMNLSMNMMPSLIPMMMQMGPLQDMFCGMPMLDPGMMMVQQQQAASLAAQQQKRARTRINDDQLKILRAYFDINNSPTEEQILEMADKSGLPPKVIKHWFRNTLFKERQRNKDSPYNFSVPPSTSLNLEEYEKTGRIHDHEHDEIDEKVHQETNKLGEKFVCNQKEEQKDYMQREFYSKSETRHKDEVQQSEEKRNVEEIQEQAHLKREFHDGPALVQTPDSRSTANTRTTISSVSNHVSGPPLTHLFTQAGLNVSFADISAALQHLPLPPPLTISTTQNSSPLNSQQSAPSTPRTLPSVSPSHHGSMQGKRANRTRFTDYQIKVLQDYFEQNAYPKDDDLEHLSRLLNLSPRVIVVWFQNARQKARKNYENQPPLDISEDGSKFTRTPGLNYQCKKCFTVFQRYYELIKHQRTHCYKDDKKMSFSLLQMMGQSSTSFGESSNSEDSCPKTDHEQSPRATSTPKLSTSATNLDASSSDVKGIEYKCEKCNLVLPRLELWREHQNIHSMNPSLFGPFSNNAFAMLHNVAQQPQSLPLISSQQKDTAKHKAAQSSISQQDERSNQTKRRLDEDDYFYESRDDQPRDKRMRTTILPEQLDYLYQKYQIDCNPSRKQLENIAAEVGLKKRVVQVWFQNTRARERKGQFRAHQQIIHKRCPFCRALFRAKSALESHLATKHPEEMSKGDINVDTIPDDPIIEANSPTVSCSGAGLDMAKLLNNPYNVPGSMMPHPNGPPDQLHNNMKKLYEDSLKHYLDELSHASHRPYSSAGQSLDEKKKSESGRTDGNDAPLDLSKHHIADKLDSTDDQIMHSKSYSMEDSKSETHSELSERDDQYVYDYMMPEDSNPPSPSSSTCSNQMHRRDLMNSSFHQKRYRTQMSSTQIKIMKHLFQSYKTPTMTECEIIGRDIGLPKRVIQVWFQNARAKEKKARLNYMKASGQMIPEMDFHPPSEQCSLCNVKYSHKYTIQDHIFTSKHIENVRQKVAGEASEKRSSIAAEQSGQKEQDMMKCVKPTSNATTTPYQSVNLQTTQPQGSFQTGVAEISHSKIKQEPKDDVVKEKMLEQSLMASQIPGLPGFPLPLGMEMTSLANGMLPFMYPGMNSIFSSMAAMPPMMPGPESMMMYDPATYGTPLTLLQIPQQAIQEVQAKVQDSNCTVARYTQDCRSLTSLKKELSHSEQSLVQSSYVDVGFICKHCHMVYPGKEACIVHQKTLCMPGSKNTNNMILKLEQQQYMCVACKERFSLISEYKAHVNTDTHIKAARGCVDGRPPSSHGSRPSSRASISTPPHARGSVTPPTSVMPQTLSTPPRSITDSHPYKPSISTAGATHLPSPIVISPKPELSDK